ncbi:MAG: 4Fe-4S dicluster domain-containing protein [Chloroflexota bacterium]|nr:4Fe-4S dicluster domain-containing protein [Chloroflexota bacterium]
MAGFLEGLKITLKTAGRKPVTAEYPAPDKRLDVQPRYMGFPALTWDGDVGEPYCTGCMVCIRNCPTQCMSAKMQDNPLHAEGKSRRRKIIDEFEINLARCILCGICVDVCNFDAIEMSHEHELSKYERNGNRADLPALLDMGKKYQQATAWQPKQPEKNSGVPPPPKALPKAAPPETSPDKPAPIELVVVSREAVERRNAVMRERAAERERESRDSTDHSAGSGQRSSRTESDD